MFKGFNPNLAYNELFNPPDWISYYYCFKSCKLGVTDNEEYSRCLNSPDTGKYDQVCEYIFTVICLTLLATGNELP